MPEASDPAGRHDTLRSTYAAYEEGGHRARWDDDQPGNRAMLDERTAVHRTLLGPHRLPVGGVLLDVGCGRGDVAHQVGADLGARAVVGIDLLPDRLAVARESHGAHFALADATALPFPDESVRVATCFTVLSSIPDAAVQAAVAADISRVLEPGGALLWYDMRYPSPGNRAVRPIGEGALRRLFPALHATVQPVTLLPPVARRVGGGAWYRRLEQVPGARSHLAAVLRKP